MAEGNDDWESFGSGSSSDDDEFTEVTNEVAIQKKPVKKGTKAAAPAKVLINSYYFLNIIQMEERGVVYLGHIPYGFFEDQIKGFFSQFGEVTRLKLARSKKVTENITCRLTYG